MKINPSLGIFGNIEKLFTERNRTNATVSNNKAETDAARITLEQALTDVDIAQIEAEQMATSLDLRVIALEAKEA